MAFSLCASLHDLFIRAEYANEAQAEVQRADADDDAGWTWIHAAAANRKKKCVAAFQNIAYTLRNIQIYISCYLWFFACK